QPHAHPWLRRSRGERRRTSDRGAARPRDAGAIRLLPQLARGRRADVGRSGDHASRRRRRATRGAPRHAADHRSPVLTPARTTIRSVIVTLCFLAAGCGDYALDLPGGYSLVRVSADEVLLADPTHAVVIMPTVDGYAIQGQLV